jgi:hypothetical protein
VPGLWFHQRGWHRRAARDHPAAGDTFTIHERWMDLDSSGAVAEIVSEPGETLTFGAQPFTWVEQFAPEGSYVVGFIVEDLDGNQTPIYTQIDVQ